MRMSRFRDRCREPAWGSLPVAKIMRKEPRHTQRQDRGSGVPLEILEHLPPKPESAYTTALCSHLHLWLYGGLSPTTSLWKRVNLQLQLIIFPGHDRSVSTYKLLWRFFSLPDRLSGHMWLFTASQPWEARDALNLLKTDFFEKLENFYYSISGLVRNYTGRGFYCWAKICCYISISLAPYTH